MGHVSHTEGSNYIILQHVSQKQFIAENINLLLFMVDVFKDVLKIMKLHFRVRRKNQAA